MKLYYAPFACSMAAHIAWREAGLDVVMLRVDWRNKRGPDGGELSSINPMAQLPTLVLHDGTVLTENAAVLPYLADRAPKRAGVAQATSTKHYELLRWLGFVGAEVHKKVLHGVFDPKSPPAVREHSRECADRPLGVLAKHLEQRETLLCDDFSVADAYLVWALMITPHAGISLEPYPALRRYLQVHSVRASVASAIAFERAERARDSHSAPGAPGA